MRENKKAKITKGVVYILINTFLWGISPWIIKQGLRYTVPVEFLFYRFTLVTIITLILFNKHLKGVCKLLKNKALIFSAVLFNFITLFLYFSGLNLTTTVEASILAGTAPLFVIAPMVLSKKEQLTIKEFVGLFIIILGYFVTLVPEIKISGVNLIGMLLIISGNITFALAVILNKRLLTDDLRDSYEFLSYVIAMLGFGILTLLQTDKFINYFRTFKKFYFF